MTTHLPAEIPTDISNVTPDWLTALLRARGYDDAQVVEVDATPVGTGQMASSFRLALRYATPCRLPDTMVAKLATGPAAQREFGSGAFRNEVRFYRELVSTFRVPTPAVFATICSDSGSEFVLLLEDIADGRQGDQIAGCSADEVRSVAVAAAGLHGPRWDDTTLLDDFPLPTPDDCDVMESLLDPMADVFRSRFTLSAAQSSVVDWLVRDAGPWIRTPAEHFALIHGDLRADNVMLRGDGSLSILDWQTITTGNPLRDIAFLLATSLTPDDRRMHERRIVTDYHHALRAWGAALSTPGAPSSVLDYTFDDCWRDYVDNLIQAPLIIVFGAAAAQPTDRGDAMFSVMLERTAAAVADLDPERLR